MSPTATALQTPPTLPPAFELTPDQRDILVAADRYAQAELYPLSRRMDDEEWWPA
jgi:isovaleryl-CoA dehydrogenase